MKIHLFGFGKQLPPIEQLPAFSTNSDVRYSLEMSGLSISINLGPCNRSRNPGAVQEFKLNYDPTSFWRGSLIHRTLGTQKLEYTERDVRKFRHSIVIGVGHVFEVYLRDPEDTTRTKNDGPLMFISREDGRIKFYPMGFDADSMSFKQDSIDDWTLTQQRFGKKFNGIWERARIA